MIICRTSIIDTNYLWDFDTVNKHKVAEHIEIRNRYGVFFIQMVYPRKETTTSFSTDTKSVDKADKFDISANLKMDFMSNSSL